MIRHIVFFSVPDREDLQTVREGLAILTGIPHARHLEIGTSAKSDLFDNSVDLVVYGEFDDEVALAAYRAHPLYQESISIVKPLRELRIAADYETEGAVVSGGE
ncbi:Dabb family protein [Rhizobium sp. RU36D]|uniref:Dabb family protein n=1 Tax=Rhizobium sp. RU36D TaxID=1907415 RepID=UPI000A031AA7|nr:Dabb family protein [Rhizobium sp. RU36D]